jgi:hypothetical protein
VDVEKFEPLHTIGGSANSFCYFGKWYEKILKILKIELPV